MAPTKLPFAVIAANTKIKRATKFSAFEIMFGRKCDAIPLLNLSKKYSTYPQEQSSDDESTHSDSLVDPKIPLRLVMILEMKWILFGKVLNQRLD